MHVIKSTNSKVNTKILLKIVVCIYFYIQQILALFTCPKQFLYQIGTNATCVSGYGKTIPCDGSDYFQAERAYINCVERYFNNEPNQEIICDTTTGTWVPEPIPCFRYCSKSGASETMKVLKNKTKYPWYAEIIKTSASNGSKEIFPALVMTGRLVITWEKYFNPRFDWDLKNYVVRIYETQNSFEDFTIERIEYISSEPAVYNYKKSTLNETFCMLILTNDKYIKINSKENAQPCLDKNMLRNHKWYLDVMKANPEYNLHPKYPSKCFVPNLKNRTNVELMCYQSLKSKPLKRCPDKVTALQTKCKLGYEKKNSSKTDFLSMCIANRWSIHDHRDENCEIICGEIDESINNGTTVKSPAWLAAIYSTETKEILSPYDQICSGVIIHKDIILSAAQCFYDKKEEKLKDPADFFIAAGKNFQKVNNSMKKYEQYVNISKIHIPPSYGKGNWDKNIAVVIAVSPLSFNLNINPICINLDSNAGLKNRASGYIFRWRPTLNDDSSKSTGIKSVNPGNYCYIKKKVNSICKKEVGGGFFFKEIIESKTRYILKGIVSFNTSGEHQCFNNLVTTVTDLHHVQEFVKTKITEHREQLDNKEMKKLIWHRVYGHKIWTAPFWIRKELNLKLKDKDPNQS